MNEEAVYSYIKDIAQRLKEPRKYGDVSVMIGAGFSKNAQCKGVANIQPPDWTELAGQMYDELYPLSLGVNVEEKEKWQQQKIIKTSGKNVTKLAEEYIANFDRNKINNLIEQSIADEMFVPGELHKQLLKLHWSDVFTTNYDTLLERTVELIYRENNYQIIHSQNDLPGSIKPRIIKLHGSIPQVKPYIICDEDYRTYPYKNSALVNTVQQAMLETRLCLIGFSGDDPNFQSWLGWLRDNMGEFCPKIYLIGIYDELSDPEKKLLENKGITIVDLSVLVFGQNENRQQEAISKFLTLLEDNQNDKDLYSERPYSEIDIFWEPNNKKEYIKQMEEYSCEVQYSIQPYILLPERQQYNYAKYFNDHFKVILESCKNEVSAKLIINIIKILRKCLVVLNDERAEKLEELENAFAQKTLQEEVLCEILLYLLEMYRFDGEKIKYQKCAEKLEKYSKKLPYYSNEFIIEKIKNYISMFEYENAINLVDKMEATTFEYKIKKAGFYIQLSQRNVADDILSECSAQLAHMKLSDEVYASYLGYLNLCYTMGNCKITEDYSDRNYYNNSYNTRQIIAKQREKLEQDFFKKDCKKAESVLPFNLNSSKSSTRIIPAETNLCVSAFSFLIGLDRLCLPMIYNQIELLPRVINIVIGTSESAYWKMSLAIRTDDEKIIDQIFTRKAIVKLVETDKKTLLESLIKVVQLYSKEMWSNDKIYFASIKNILIVMSRVVILMEDEYIVNFLSILSEFSHTDDKFVTQELLKTISNRFNGSIATTCQNIIFNDFAAECCLASYFESISFEIDSDYVQEYYCKALKSIEEGEGKDRENGIAQLLLLWENHPLEKYKKDICTLLWKNNGDQLPESESYFPYVWEKLPHPESVKFPELYYRYLIDTEFIQSVTPKGYSRNFSYDSVRNYFTFFYVTSDISLEKCNKVLLDKELTDIILNRCYEFILHEKELIDISIDLRGFRRECIQKFMVICELVALVYLEAIRYKIIINQSPLIEKIKEELKNLDINIVAIDMVEMIQKKEYVTCMNAFENILLMKNKEYYSEAFTGALCLVYQVSDIENTGVSFENLFNVIKYLDIENAKTIWNYLAPILRQTYFLREEVQKYVSLSIKKCIEIYEELANEGERFYLDALYNCVNTLCQYYEFVKNENGNVIKELKECVERAKAIPNYEIHNILS